MLMLMTTDASTTSNSRKAAQVHAVLTEILREALRRGFFGTVAVELSVNDGTIQHIRSTVDRIER